MIVTDVHAQYWLHRANLPAWVKKVMAERSNKFRVTVHDCINAQTDRKRTTDNQIAIQNMVNICRVHRKHSGPLLPYLDQLAIDPGTIINPKKRMAVAAKWAKMIRKRA